MSTFALQNDFDKINEELYNFAPKHEVEEIKSKLSSLARTEEIMEEIKSTKDFFNKQVENFVVKDDFSETFQQIDDTLSEHQEAISQNQENCDILNIAINNLKETLKLKR